MRGHGRSVQRPLVQPQALKEEGELAGGGGGVRAQARGRGAVKDALHGRAHGRAGRAQEAAPGASHGHKGRVGAPHCAGVKEAVVGGEHAQHVAAARGQGGGVCAALPAAGPRGAAGDGAVNAQHARRARVVALNEHRGAPRAPRPQAVAGVEAQPVHCAHHHAIVGEGRLVGPVRGRGGGRGD